MSRKTKHMVGVWKKKIARVGAEYKSRTKSDYLNQWGIVGIRLAMFDYYFETGRLGTITDTDRLNSNNELILN